MKYFVHPFSVICAVLTIYPSLAKATHSSAMELYYYWVSGSTYNFTLTFYRNCQGLTAAAPSAITLSGSSSTIGKSVGANLGRLPTSGSGVPPLEPPELYNCAVPNTLCFEEYVYRGNVTLTGNARDWYFYYSLCCVPVETDNISTSGSMEVFAGINNLDFPDTLAQNISPVWHTRRPNIPGHLTDTVINFPIKTYCEMRQYQIDQSTHEYQGDRVKYEFLTPNGNFRNPPYTLNHPLPFDSPPAFRIDTATGNILYKPIPPTGSYGSVKLYLLTIKATEYRMDTDLVNGNIVNVEKPIGFIMRNFFISTTDSANCPDNSISYADSTSLTTATSEIDIRCDNNPIQIAFTDAILCSSIDSNGSNVVILNTATSDTVKVLRNEGSACSVFRSTRSFRIFLDSALDAGEYILIFVKGMDGNTVITDCGLELKEFEDTLFIHVYPSPGKGEIIGDTIIGSRDTVYMECRANQFVVSLNQRAFCNSLTGSGSEFILRDESIVPPIDIPIKSAAPLACGNGFMSRFKIDLVNPLENGLYRLYLVNGSDNNSLLDECYRNWDGSSVYLRVPDLSLKLGEDFTYCRNSHFDTLIYADSGYANYNWNTGAYTRYLYIDTAGTYWVKVFSHNGCFKSDTIQVSEIECFLGFGQPGIPEVEVYPNPARDVIYVNLYRISQETVFRLKDVNGREIIEVSLKPGKNTVDAKSINPGLYIFQISFDGISTSTGKVLIH